MAVRARTSGVADTAATSHAVTLPAGVQVGDRLIVCFTNDTEDSSASTASTGWSSLGTVAQGTTTNHRATVFTKVATGSDALSVDLSIAEEATWVSFCMQGNGGAPTVASGNGSSGTTATFTAISGLTTGNYDSILFCSTDANTDTDLNLDVTFPAGWVNKVTQRAGVTTSAHTFSVDQTLSSVASVSPGNATLSEAEQWITWNVAAPVPVAGGGGGTEPLVRGATSASPSTGSTPAVVPKPSGLVVGDLILAFQVADNDGTLTSMTGPAGWTTIASQAAVSGGQPAVKVWQQVATATEVAASDFTFEVGAGNIFCSAGIIAITEGTFDPATPLFVGPVFEINAASSTSHVAPSIGTGVTNGLLITAHSTDQGGASSCSYTPPSGMTERIDTAASSGWTCLEVNTLVLASSGATSSKTATCTANRPATCVSLIVAPAVASGINLAQRTGGFLQLL